MKGPELELTTSKATDILPRDPPTCDILYKTFAVLALAVTFATAETHVISFDNRSVLQCSGHSACRFQEARLTSNTIHQGADVVLPP